MWFLNHLVKIGVYVCTMFAQTKKITIMCDFSQKTFGDVN